jgi:hypothetical protein
MVWGMEMGVGLRVNFAGGPIPALILSARPEPRWLLSLSFGGFPTGAGPILRVEANGRYLFNEEKSRSYYIQAGCGNTWIFYNEKAREIRGVERLNVRDFHFSGGISRNYSDVIVSGDVGFLYAPYFINPGMRERFGNVVPIVPMIDIEGVYRINKEGGE